MQIPRTKNKIFKDFTCVPCFSIPVLSVLLNTSVGDSEVTLFGISKSYGIASMCLALIAVTTKCKTTIRVKAMNVNFQDLRKKTIGFRRDQFLIMGY